MTVRHQWDDFETTIKILWHNRARHPWNSCKPIMRWLWTQSILPSFYNMSNYSMSKSHFSQPFVWHWWFQRSQLSVALSEKHETTVRQPGDDCKTANESWLTFYVLTLFIECQKRSYFVCGEWNFVFSNLPHSTGFWIAWS